MAAVSTVITPAGNLQELEHEMSQRTSGPKRTFSIQLSADDYRLLEAAARLTDRSKGAVIRRAIRDWITPRLADLTIAAERDREAVRAVSAPDEDTTSI